MQNIYLTERYKKKCLLLFSGLIYIVGGCTHHSRHRQDVISYNPVTGEWSCLAPMLTPRSQMGITILDGFIYVVGGTNKTQEVLTSVERYSFEKVRTHPTHFTIFTKIILDYVIFILNRNKFFI